MDKNILFPLGLIFLFSLLGMQALFEPYLYTGHDVWHNLARFYHYHQAVLDGQILPYWISNLSNHYGYPLFFFSYPLPWIIGLPLLLAGIELAVAFKSLIFLSFLFSGIFMFILCDRLFKDSRSAVLSAILYIWAPYHFLTIFVSVSVGQAFVFTFLPLLILGIYFMSQKDRFVPGLIFIVIGQSGILLSHLISAVFCLPLIIILTIAFFHQRNKVVTPAIFIKRLVIAGSLGLLVSAFYLLPALFYSSQTAIRSVGGFSEIYQTNFVNLSQLIYSRWGYGPIISNAKDGEISFQIGIAQWLGIFGLIFFLFKRKIGSHKIIIYILITFALSIFLMLEQSSFIWSLVTKVVALDYPFRFLLPVTFIASLAAGMLLNLSDERFRKALFLFLIMICLYTNRNHIRVNMYVTEKYDGYIAAEVTTNTFDEYRPKEAATHLFKKAGPLIYPEQMRISNYSQNTKQTSFILEATESAVVSVGQFAFPGQTLYLDRAKTNYTTNDIGLITFPVSPANHSVLIRFENTPLINTSRVLSVVGIMLFVLSVIYRRKLKNL